MVKGETDVLSLLHHVKMHTTINTAKSPPQDRLQASAHYADLRRGLVKILKIRRHEKTRRACGIRRWHGSIGILRRKEACHDVADSHDDGSRGAHGIQARFSVLSVLDSRDQVFEARFGVVKGFNRIPAQALDIIALRVDNQCEVCDDVRVEEEQRGERLETDSINRIEEKQ